MPAFSELILVESRSARDNQIAEIPDESIQSVLDKVKALHFAHCNGTGFATTEQMAEFYEVPVGTVQTVIKSNRDELSDDGLKTLRGKALKDVMSIIDITSKTPNLTVWTPCAALRLGMLLRDSVVAKQLRTYLLDRLAHPAASVSDSSQLALQVQELRSTCELLQAQMTLLIQRQPSFRQSHQQAQLPQSIPLQSLQSVESISDFQRRKNQQELESLQNPESMASRNCRSVARLHSLRQI